MFQTGTSKTTEASSLLEGVTLTMSRFPYPLISRSLTNSDPLPQKILAPPLSGVAINFRQGVRPSVVFLGHLIYALL